MTCLVLLSLFIWNRMNSQFAGVNERPLRVGLIALIDPHADMTVLLKSPDVPP